MIAKKSEVKYPQAVGHFVLVEKLEVNVTPGGVVLPAGKNLNVGVVRSIGGSAFSEMANTAEICLGDVISYAHEVGRVMSEGLNGIELIAVNDVSILADHGKRE